MSSNESQSVNAAETTKPNEPGVTQVTPQEVPSVGVEKSLSTSIGRAHV